MIKNLLIAAFLTCFVCANIQGVFLFLVCVKLIMWSILDEYNQRVILKSRAK